MTSPTAPDPAAAQRPPLFSSVFWTELVLVIVVVGLVIWAAPDLLASARSLAPVHTPAPATAANAYPRLVQALRSVHEAEEGIGETDRPHFVALRVLLRELGEEQ